MKHTLILVAGYAGSGKSTIAKIIASKLRAPLIDQDTLVKPIIDRAMELLTGNPNDREGLVYRNEFKLREYESTMDVAWQNLRINPNVVAVAPFTSCLKDKEWVERFRRKTERAPANWYIILVRSSDEAIQKLLKVRRAPRDEWKIQHWDEYVATLPTKPPLEYVKDKARLFTNNARSLIEIEKDIDTLLKELDLQIYT